MQILDTPYEIGFHLIILMDSWYPSFLTKGKLWLLECLLTCNLDTNKRIANPFLLAMALNRKELVDKALRLLINKGIVISKPTDEGFQYRLGGSSTPLLKALEEPFGDQVRVVAKRLHEKYGTCSAHDLFQVLSARVKESRESLSTPLFKQEEEE